jgi:lipoyl(octanoyl) transferase
MSAVEIRWLGRLSYSDALTLQEQLVEDLCAGVAGDQLLLLEHDPVYTMGRTPDESSLRGGEHLPHPLFRTNRGGQATYHGPGQLIGYPILDLRRHGDDLHRYLRALEAAVIETLAGFGVEAIRREGLTGVWVEQRKIASIGVGIRRSITMHGFALNVCGDLSPFSQITPCGIAGVEMTSIEKESGRGVRVNEAAERFAGVFEARFGDVACETHATAGGTPTLPSIIPPPAPHTH